MSCQDMRATPSFTLNDAVIGPLSGHDSYYSIFLVHTKETGLEPEWLIKVPQMKSHESI